MKDTNATEKNNKCFDEVEIMNGKVNKKLVIDNSVTDEELESVFGGVVLPKGRRTFTRKCPCSIGKCC